MLRVCLTRVLQPNVLNSVRGNLVPRRCFTSAFEPSRPDNVQVPVGASGSISLDIYHPPRPVQPASVVISFPRGPLASKAPSAPTNLSALAIAANLTVVQVNYRLTRDYLYPIPIHDALAGYDWVVKHLVSSPTSKAANGNSQDQEYGKIGVCGELIGGSIAAAVGLTECHIHGHGVRAMVLGNPISDWTAMYPISANHMTPDLNPGKPAKKTKAGRRRKEKRPSWLVNSDDALLPVREALKARTTLFRRAADYFDPFASPQLFFQTPRTEVPPDVDPLEELLAELEGVVRPTDQKSISARKYPPLGSELELPYTRIWVGNGCCLRDQGVELAKVIGKTLPEGRVSVEGMEGTGLWETEQLMEMGAWFGHVLRSS